MAQKFVSHIKEAQGLEIQLIRQVGGNPRTIAWTSRHDSLAAFEANMQAIETNEVYQAMSQEAGGIFKDGTLADQLYATID